MRNLIQIMFMGLVILEYQIISMEKNNSHLMVIMLKIMIILDIPMDIMKKDIRKKQENNKK